MGPLVNMQNPPRIYNGNARITAIRIAARGGGG